MHIIETTCDRVEWIKLAQNIPRGRLLFENIIHTNLSECVYW